MRQLSHSLQSWYVFTAQYLQNFPYFSTFHGIRTNIIHRRQINSILMSTTCSPILGELLNPGHISLQRFKVGAVQIWLFKYQTSTFETSWFLCKKAYTTCEQSLWLKLNSEHLVVTFLHAFQLESKQPTSFSITELDSERQICPFDLTQKLPNYSKGEIISLVLPQRTNL